MKEHFASHVSFELWSQIRFREFVKILKNKFLKKYWESSIERFFGTSVRIVIWKILGVISILIDINEWIILEVQEKNLFKSKNELKCIINSNWKRYRIFLWNMYIHWISSDLMNITDKETVLFNNFVLNLK